MRGKGSEQEHLHQVIAWLVRGLVSREQQLRRIRTDNRESGGLEANTLAPFY